MLCNISLQLIYFIHSSLYLVSLCPYLASLSSLTLVTTSLFSISVCLLLFYYTHLFVLFFRFHIQVVTYSFVFDFISLSIIPTGSIYLTANGILAFFFMSNISHTHTHIYIYIYTHTYIYIHTHTHYTHTHIHIYTTSSLSIHGHLGCLYILPITNNVAMNTEVHVSFWISVFIFFRYST